VSSLDRVVPRIVFRMEVDTGRADRGMPEGFAHVSQVDISEATTDGSDRVGAAVHAAWVKHDVAQCGYCQSGQIMSATAFLKSLPKGKQPKPAEIDAAMAGNICRCETNARIRAAVADAAKTLA